jgi:hypothetical protein
MTRDWRLEHLETQPYLRGVCFERKPYRPPRPGWEHDHCAGCWAKLAQAGDATAGADLVHEGYATCADFMRGADYEWVCIPCFDRFAAAMN